MKTSLLRKVAFATLVWLGVSSAGCGYILYPERRGNSGGSIDGGTLVMDCLWLLAGIIPGVVFLIVDFTSGAMYVGGRSAVQLSADGALKLDLLDTMESRQLLVRVVDGSNRVIDEQATAVGPTVRGASVVLDLHDAPHGKQGALFVQVRDAKDPSTLLQSLQVL